MSDRTILSLILLLVGISILGNLGGSVARDRIETKIDALQCHPTAHKETE